MDRYVYVDRRTIGASVSNCELGIIVRIQAYLFF